MKGTDFFTDEYGANNDLLARIINRYPRKAGRLIENICDCYADFRYGKKIAKIAKHLVPEKKILAIGIEVPGREEWLSRVVRKLAATHHDLTIQTTPMGTRQRIDNLNNVIRAQAINDFDWVITFDDDIDIPENFLDTFILLIESFDFDIAQPAHNYVSNMSFRINRRNCFSLARHTGFVEVGPLVAFRRTVYQHLLPFPDIGMGHGLDIHWAHKSVQEKWRLGIVDYTPIRHLNPVGNHYSQQSMRSNASEYIAQHGGAMRREALVTHKRYSHLNYHCDT